MGDTAGMWSVGYFGNSDTTTVDLSKLPLSEAEVKILTQMQYRYKMMQAYRHQNEEAYNREKLHIIRGMKYAFDEIRTTEDGFKQSIDWQAVLY